MMYLVLFFFNDTATTEIYTLSLHDALPIAGFVALVFTNASRAMPPWGGREPLLGTSPLAAGAPGGKLAPFVLDMSPAVAARRNIRPAQKRGERIPPAYPLAPQRRPTTQPT